MNHLISWLQHTTAHVYIYLLLLFISGTLHCDFGYLRVFWCIYMIYSNAAKNSWMTEESASLALAS